MRQQLNRLICVAQLKQVGQTKAVTHPHPRCTGVDSTLDSRLAFDTTHPPVNNEQPPLPCADP